MERFGLIGKTLSHSFSKNYFEEKFQKSGLKDCIYENYELENIETIRDLVKGNPDLKGLNVTIPYKKSVIKFLDELTKDAKEIGAVNCIEIRDGKLKGHNTDHYGFKQSIKPFLEPQHENALILGTGGSSKAVAYALESVGVKVYFASSTKEGQEIFSYDQLNEYTIKGIKLIVNTTPLGMSPNIDSCPPIPYHFLSGEHLCYDLIYNPPETLFLQNCRKYGAVTMNGLSMLKLQAEKSWEIWNSA